MENVQVFTNLNKLTGLSEKLKKKSITNQTINDGQNKKGNRDIEINLKSAKLRIEADLKYE